jgi:hypothetical protein
MGMPLPSLRKKPIYAARIWLRVLWYEILVLARKIRDRASANPMSARQRQIMNHCMGTDWRRRPMFEDGKDGLETLTLGGFAERHGFSREEVEQALVSPVLAQGLVVTGLHEAFRVLHL